jgi:hypothetical protein
VQVVDPRGVHLLPSRVDHAGQPGRMRNRQGLQHRPQGLPGQLQPVQVPDRSQHMGGVGPYPTPRLDQPLADQPFQQRIQRQPDQVLTHQPVTELAQHARVEPRVLQLHTDGVLPGDPVPDRLGSLPVGQVLRELQHRDDHQLGRRDPRLTPHPERTGERLVGIHSTQLVPDPHRQVPLARRRTRRPRSHLRNLRPRLGLHRHDTHQSAAERRGKATAARSSTPQTRTSRTERGVSPINHQGPAQLRRRAGGRGVGGSGTSLWRLGAGAVDVDGVTGGGCNGGLKSRITATH